MSAHDASCACFTDCCDRDECACDALEWADVFEAEEPALPLRSPMWAGGA